jgi:hypothetical protein
LALVYLVMVCVCILCRLKEVGQIVLDTLNDITMLDEEQVEQVVMALEEVEMALEEEPELDQPGRLAEQKWPAGQRGLRSPNEEQDEEVEMALVEAEMAHEEEPELDQPGRLVEQMWPVGQRGLRSPKVAPKKMPLTKLLPPWRRHGADTGRMQLSSSSSSHGADTGRTQLIGGGTGWRHPLMRPPATPPSAKLLASYGLQLNKHR